MSIHSEVNGFMLKHFEDSHIIGGCYASIPSGVCNILTKYWDWFNKCPASFSGKFHKNERTILDHVENTLYFAHRIIEEFDIKGLDKIILLAGVTLHDIGKVKIMKHSSTFYCGVIPDNWESNLKNGWRRKKVDGSAHIALGTVIILENAFAGCEYVISLVETHGSHWYKYTKRPETFLEKMCALCDYLASREEVIIQDKV